MLRARLLVGGVLTSLSVWQCSASNDRSNDIGTCIGNTPLIYLRSVSEATGCKIYAKCEFMNPTGSVKDRAAYSMIMEAEKKGLKQGDVITEGTGGNTGISLAQIGKARGYNVILCMPNNISDEKIDTMRRLGAEVHVQPVVAFSSPQHYAQRAAALAVERGGICTNQFENLANFRAHFGGTGPEIWQQSQRSVDVFVSSAGTGGTIAGVSAFLKTVNPNIHVVLADPAGSSLYSYIKQGTMDSAGSTMVEGIGIGRITENFKQAAIDDAIRVSDQEAVEMAYYLMRNEGLFVGPSAALNVAAAVKVALQRGRTNEVIVTILCDSGDRYDLLCLTGNDAYRYVTKMYDPDWLHFNKLTPKGNGTSVDFIK